MKKHIWKKSFSISFVFHFIVVITIGAMVARLSSRDTKTKRRIDYSQSSGHTETSKLKKISFNSF